MSPLTGLLLGLLLFPLAGGIFVWFACPRCPRCGSIRKANWPREESGQFHRAAICGACHHVWDWQA